MAPFEQRNMPKNEFEKNSACAQHRTTTFHPRVSHHTVFIVQKSGTGADAECARGAASSCTTLRVVIGMSRHMPTNSTLSRKSSGESTNFKAAIDADHTHR